jgi:hypothetical protein
VESRKPEDPKALACASQPRDVTPFAVRWLAAKGRIFSLLSGTTERGCEKVIFQPSISFQGCL